MLRQKLGAGSVGTVYLAHDTARQRRVALKVIRTDRMTAEAVAHMQREFRAVASLNHTQIAAGYDFGYTENGLPFYTREYIDGEPLPPGPPDNRAPLDYLSPLLDLLDALRYLHENDILHLDIHAGNLILSEDPDRGGVLIDFGFAGSLEGSLYTRFDCGSLALPPELLRRGEATAQTDVFLVGRLLHYRLSGRMGGEVRLPREIPGWGPRLTLNLERIAAKAMQPLAAQRFQSARELRDALAHALGADSNSSRSAQPRDVTVGRDRELEAIEALLRDVGTGSPRVLAFSSGHGLGKTRLLEEARLRSQLRGLDVVEAAGEESEGRGLLLLKALRGASARAASPHAGWRWLEPLHAKYGGTPRERAYRAAEAYFAEKGPPLVLLADDLELLDQESLVLLEALASVVHERARRELPGRGMGLLVATTRESLAWIEKKGIRRVKPLGRDAARQLIRELLIPISVRDRLLEEIVHEAAGVPLYLQQVAGALREEWSHADALPEGLESLERISRLLRSTGAAREDLCAEDRPVFELMGLVERPARLADIVAGLSLPKQEVMASLRRLKDLRIVAVVGKGRHLRYKLCTEFGRDELGERWSPAAVRQIHCRMAEELEQRLSKSPRDHEDLARHLLAAGRVLEGCAMALESAHMLRKQGAFDRAFRLLETTSREPLSLENTFRLAEEMSAIAEETGDHAAGIRVVEPIYREQLAKLSSLQAMRMRRCLGIHYHRAGMADRALQVFEEAQRAAHGDEDLRDVIFIDSELAEIYTFRSQYAEAEETCRRGLRRLQDVAKDGPFYSSMEVTLRGSLGHLKLRCMDLASARRELSRALGACTRHETTANRAAILNNLGIAASQADDYPDAVRYFEKAKKLSSAAGERRAIVTITSNLALVHAKLGERDKAKAQLDGAAQLLYYYRGKRVEFFVAYARGAVSLLLGEAREAIESLEQALPLGRQLEDAHMVHYGEVYLAEAHLISGDYQRAWKQLTSTAKSAEKTGNSLLTRMVHSRSWFLATLLGRPRLAQRARKVVETTPRTAVVFLESWNDLFCGMAAVLAGEDGTPAVESALEAFERMEIPAGSRCAGMVLLVMALMSCDRARVRENLVHLERGDAVHHRLIEAAAPLVRAEARLFLGEKDAAEIALQEASSAIVGSPFLELDGRIELLRARLALQGGDNHEARRHLHRSSHIRGLLVRLIPARFRERYLSQPRFDVWRETERRLSHSPHVVSTESLRGGSCFEGIVGQSPSMLTVFRVIEKIADQEVGVLLTGETGTGKELVARAIHRRSTRAQKPFLALHCATVPAEVFESELFGAARGAYTGADEARPGLLESLAGGTLLLDAVDQLPLDGQAKLLRVLESGTFRRLGDVELQRVDLRFLASTSERLSSAVAAGRFRADLYYRLRGVEIELPPLRRRVEDIALLAQHFVQKHAQRLAVRVPQLTDDALSLLRDDPWSGNVRELEGVLLRVMVTLSTADSVAAREVRPYLTRPVTSSPEEMLFKRGLVELGELRDLKRSLERQYLIELFFQCEGDMQVVMERLGVKTTRLYAWFRELGVDLRRLRKKL